MSYWLPSTITYLEQKDYEKVIQIYEDRINDNPDEISNYWYLGLAYLLAEKEELCQSIWLTAFLLVEEENQGYYQEILLEILTQESNYQEDQENFYLSYIIREQYREINPQKVNNLLKLILLKVKLNILSLEELKIWNINKLIINSPNNAIDETILFSVTDILLSIPVDETVDFANAIYSYFQGSQKIVDLLLSKAETMGYEKRYFNYGAKLVEICWVNQPDNLDILKQVISYYSFNKQYEKVKTLTEIFYQKSKTLPEKTLALLQLVGNNMAVGDWQKLFSIIPEYKAILNELIEQQPTIEEAYIRNSLSKHTQPLLYFDDRAKEKREIINGIGKLFQKLTQDHYSCPVHFISSEQKTRARKLKIGYIGHTMRSHSVGFLSRWLIHHHNQEKFEIYTYFVCYQVEDNVTKKFFKEPVTKSYNSSNVLNDLITQIEKDEIDILVDLDSFTHNMTSMVMALKPAPIQISWLGMDSNGIPAIDYFIADPYVLPDKAQEYYQEKIWRLPHTYLAVDGFEVDFPTISRQDLEIPSDAIIYLNIQNAWKRHPEMIHTQMKIIKAVPNSYLFIKGYGDADIVENTFITIAQEEGIDRTRLRFLERSETEAIHRANLQIADIVLDTFPYNGATTTLETLWMEIPIVTRVGEQFAARNSYTFMINAGISEGIAWSDQEYIEWGIKLGTDKELRKEISWKLRQSKKKSLLWNGKQFTLEMENAYQQMWEIYLNK